MSVHIDHTAETIVTDGGDLVFEKDGANEAAVSDLKAAYTHSQDGNHFPQTWASFGFEWIVSTAVTRYAVVIATYDHGYNISWYPTVAADGVTIQIPLFLKAGTYDFDFYGFTAGSYGKIDWVLDGSTIASGQDWYSAGITANVRKAVSGVTVTGDGYHKLVGTVNGKNVASSSYGWALTHVMAKVTSYGARS